MHYCMVQARARQAITEKKRTRTNISRRSRWRGRRSKADQQKGEEKVAPILAGEAGAGGEGEARLTNRRVKRR